MTDRTGIRLIQDARTNKGTAFTEEEREKYHLQGLLPYAVTSLASQEIRVLKNLRRKESNIEKYIFLTGLHYRNERLFYRVVMNNIEELMPVIYTPTVGQACQEFAHNFRYAQGFYVTPKSRGKIAQHLDNWPEKDVRLIVVTDGERILGLGDLGANGMGIPIGKLALYSACAGIPPEQCLPVTIDVGTNNQALREDPLYLGLNRPRELSDEDYLSLIEEFVDAIKLKYPKALIQFEDFITPNAYRLLDHFRDQTLCFNDDIQGTATVAFAGILATTRISKTPLADLRVLFLGAGSAATGIGDLLCYALQQEGLSEEAAKERVSFINSKGLVTRHQKSLGDFVRPYAKDCEPMSFIEAVEKFKPHIIVGATGSAGAIGEDVVKLLCHLHERPAIFALSNPTSHAECTAEEAYRWSDGKAIFASGSPFAPVTLGEKTFVPGQGNNAYVFPGIGLGALACEASRITDDMFLRAAQCLADLVNEENLDLGLIYPKLTEIRHVSLKIACAVAEVAYEKGLAKGQKPDDLESFIAKLMYNPAY